MVSSISDNMSVFMAPGVKVSSRGMAKGGLIFTLNKEIFMSQLVSIKPELFFISFIINCGVENLNFYDYCVIPNHSFTPTRISKDFNVNSRGRLYMERNEFILCNKRSLAVSPAQFTYMVGNGSSVIRFVWGSLTI